MINFYLFLCICTFSVVVPLLDMFCRVRSDIFHFLCRYFVFVITNYFGMTYINLVIIIMGWYLDNMMLLCQGRQLSCVPPVGRLRIRNMNLEVNANKKSYLFYRT